jgi:hypothetical protein
LCLKSGLDLVEADIGIEKPLSPLDRGDAPSSTLAIISLAMIFQQDEQLIGRQVHPVIIIPASDGVPVCEQLTNQMAVLFTLG